MTKRSAKVERFEAGWQVVCMTDKEVTHCLYIWDVDFPGLDLALNLALGRAEIWVKAGIAATLPVLMGGVDLGLLTESKSQQDSVSRQEVLQ